MFTPHDIIVPVDFSKPSRMAAERALSLGRCFGASLHLIHALEIPPAWSHSELSASTASWEETRRNTREEFRKFENDLGDKAEFASTEVIEADPVSAIRSSARKHSANLIVMGAHGYRGLKHLMLGSVAERTIREVDCATLAVKASASPADEPIRRILLATDFSAGAGQAQDIAQSVAEASGAELEVLHVFVLPRKLVGPYGIPPSSEAFERVRDQARTKLEGETGLLHESGLTVRRHLRQGLPSQVIAREAETLEVDLIVMGTRGNTGIKHALLGSVAERTLRAAPCSVLTAKVGVPT